MFGMVTCMYAQKPTIELTFTADNNGQHVPLNSILIENLSQGGDTTLYAPDTVLALDYVTGMEEIIGFSGKGFSLSQNYPNPMKGKTTIGLRLPESGNILLTVSDIIGRKVVDQAFQLEQGIHSFTFYPGGESLYFLTVQAYDQLRTIKMLNDLSGSFSSGILRLEYNGQQQAGAGEYKSGNALTNFVFDLGDLLKFTSFTALGERVISSTPADNQTYYFHYTGEPCPGTPTVTDIEGNVYNSVQIGTQCWMAENLKTTTYSNGTAIPNVTDAIAWSTLTTGAYIWYDNDIGWKDSYGALYNGFTTVDPNGLCPTGWHVPTNDEWTELTDYLGGTASPYGNELKSCRRMNSPLGGGCNTNEHPRWHEYNEQWGTDDYGFSGLPGGHRFGSGNFEGIGYIGYWWSSTEVSSANGWGRFLNYWLGSVGEADSPKQDGFSVRCVKD